MKTWTKIFIEPMKGGVHWVCLTNDDNMDDKPDGFICVTQGTGPDVNSMLKIFGTSRMDGNRKIDVYVDGVEYGETNITRSH